MIQDSGVRFSCRAAPLGPEGRAVLRGSPHLSSGWDLRADLVSTSVLVTGCVWWLKEEGGSRWRGLME